MGLAKWKVFLLVGALFAMVLFGTQGFFADEFQYFQSYGSELWGGNWIRLPLTPFLVKSFGAFGLEYDNQGGLLLYKALQWVIGISGAFLLGKEVTGTVEGGWLGVLVLGTLYAWVFYAGKVLTDALLVGIGLWFAWLALRTRRMSLEPSGFAFPELSLAGLAFVTCLGLLTKPTFAAFIPLSIPVFLLPKKYASIVFGAGFAIILCFAGFSLSQIGADRYFLPAWAFLALGMTFLAYEKHWGIGWSVAALFVGVGLAQFVLYFPVDAQKFYEFEAVREFGVQGTVAANMPDYTVFYAEKGLALMYDWKRFNGDYSSCDWVVLSDKNFEVRSEILLEKELLRENEGFVEVFKNEGLSLFKKVV